MRETIAGRYRLGERLGAGGMAEVWSADDTQLDRLVAVKLLGARADAERFEREARAVAALSPPNISRLYDYGTEAGRRTWSSNTSPAAHSKVASRRGRRSTMRAQG